MEVSSCNSFVCSDDVGSYDGSIFQLTEPFHQGLAVGTEKNSVSSFAKLVFDYGIAVWNQSILPNSW